MAYIECSNGGVQPIEIPKLQYIPTASGTGGNADYQETVFKLDKKYTTLQIESCVWYRMRYEYTSIIGVLNGTETSLDRLSSAFTSENPYTLDVSGYDSLIFRVTAGASAYNYDPPKFIYYNITIV